MTIGEIAGLIAALAFVVLVAFICINLSKLSQIMKEINQTVSKVNVTIDVLTKDVDNLSIEVEGLLNKANTLVDDLNGKLNKTDPLFTAIGDLGETVSDLNDSTKQMTSNLLSGTLGKKKKSSPIQKFVNSTKTVARSRPSRSSTNVYASDTDLHTENSPTEAEIIEMLTKDRANPTEEIKLK